MPRDEAAPSRLAPTTRAVKRLVSRALDTVLPAQCLGCGVLVETPGTLCPECWEPLRFVEQPMCRACGLPLEIDVGGDALCGGCALAPPIYDRARSAVTYDAASKHMILGFKYSDRTDAAPAFARWMVRAGRELLAEADVIVCVPVHWTRLLTRRYNQAALLAKEISRLTSLPFDADVLVRRRRTEKLAKLGRGAREKMLRNVFTVPPRRAPRVKAKRVLLIDDVHTTGSTAVGCTVALLGGGAAAVDLLTLARAARPHG